MRKVRFNHLRLPAACRGGDRQSDLDLLVDIQEGASLFCMVGFCYETEKILGVQVDDISFSVLPKVRDLEFVTNIQREAIS